MKPAVTDEAERYIYKQERAILRAIARLEHVTSDPSQPVRYRALADVVLLKFQRESDEEPPHDR